MTSAGTAWDSPADAQEFFDTYSTFVVALAGGNPQLLQSDAQHMRWQLADRQMYAHKAGRKRERGSGESTMAAAL